MEDEGMVSENARNLQEAWNAAIAQALVNERGFYQFCREVRTLKSLPNSPDFRFLMLLKEFIEGHGSAESALGLKGLSTNAEKLRSKFSTFLSSSPQQEKLQSLLEKFIREPDKITRRHYEQAAGLIPIDVLRIPTDQMGELISLSRGLNQKAAVAKGWDAVPLGRLTSLDSKLNQVAQYLPQAIREILLHPFVHNLAVMCRRLAPEARSSAASQLVRAIPFLLPRLAGEKFQEVERKLLINREEWWEGAQSGIEQLQARVEGMSLEEKLALLRSLRLKIRAQPPEEPDFDDLPFDEDDDDYEDDFPEDRASEAAGLAGPLLLLDRSILKDISVRLPEDHSRERKGLVRVMEPILLHDLCYIFDTSEDLDDILGILDSAIDAGCAGIRMGLLAVLAGAALRNGDLRRRAEKLLDKLPAPTPEDMEWLAAEWKDLYFPIARSLTPLLARYKSDKNLLRVFSFQLCGMSELIMLETLLKKELSKFEPGLSDLLDPPKPEEPGILRRELNALTEYEVLDHARNFLRCYADGRLSVEGHLCWLKASHALNPKGVWEFALADLKRYESMISKSTEILPMKSFETLRIDKAEAIWLFLKEHPDEPATIPSETLGPLLAGLLENLRTPLSYHTLFIRIEKILAERVKGGDETVKPIMERLRRTLLELSGPARKTSKSRKYKR